jgi:hypothetical protein
LFFLRADEHSNTGWFYPRYIVNPAEHKMELKANTAPADPTLVSFANVDGKLVIDVEAYFPPGHTPTGHVTIDESVFRVRLDFKGDGSLIIPLNGGWLSYQCCAPGHFTYKTDTLASYTS